MSAVLIKKAAPCIYSEDVLKFQKAVLIARNGYFDGFREPYWREIRITLTSEKIKVGLGYVDEECATGGYCSLWRGCRDYQITWENLAKDYFIVEFEMWLEEEVEVVRTKASEMLEEIKTNMEHYTVVLS